MYVIFSFVDNFEYHWLLGVKQKYFCEKLNKNNI